MPPLSFLDKLIYWLLFVILFGGIIALGFLPFYIRDRIAFSDPSVVAALGDGAVIVLLSFPVITIFLLWFIPWVSWYEQRKPIFGLPNFKYGPPAWPKEYPLFMKNKPFVWESQWSKQRHKRIVTVMLVLLLVSVIPFPLSLYGRDCLRQDGSIVQYNLFNAQTHEYAPGKVKEIRLGVHRRRSRGHHYRPHYYAQITLVLDNGQKYSFEGRDFKNESETDLFWLNTMAELKDCYSPENIYYEGTDKLDALAEHVNLNPEQMQILYRLFGQN